jgi:hypothetical protein
VAAAVADNKPLRGTVGGSNHGRSKRDNGEQR